MTGPPDPAYGQLDRAYLARLATTPDEDGPVWMVNLMKYRDRAIYADGRDTDISGREADDVYTPFASLTAVGAEIVFAADVEDQLLGAAPVWDRIGVVKYPTRASFIELQAREDFQAQHVHKVAGMEQTIVIGCWPIPVPSFPPGVTEVDWADVPHPPTEDDGPVMVMHVIRFADDVVGVTPAEMQAYQSAAALIAVPHGLRLPAWFAVEGTVVGDGREWHQARFNAFPSKAAFMAVATNPARLEAQKRHREVAIADTYTMILRPVVDTLADSVRAPIGGSAPRSS